MIVAFDAYAYSKPRKGLKLQPVAVQIVDLVEGEEVGDAEKFGFGEMESGFKQDATEEEFPFDTQEEEDEENADF